MCSSPVPQSRACCSLRIEFLPGRFQHRARRQAVLAFQRFGHAAIDVPPPAAHLAPRADQFDAALLERSARVGNQPLGIERVDLPQPVALGAHPLRTVEAEQLRAGRLEAQVAVRAGVVGGKRRCRSADRGVAESRVGRRDVGDCRLRVSRFARLRLLAPLRSRSSSSIATIRFPSPSRSASSTASANRGRDLRAGHQPIDHHFDVVPHLAVQPQIVAQPDHAAIDPGAGEALLQQVGEQVAVFALLAADQRRQHQEPRAGRQRPRSAR